MARCAGNCLPSVGRLSQLACRAFDDEELTPEELHR